MFESNYIGKGSLAILSLLFSLNVGCSSVAPRQWEMEKAITPYVIYDASRIYLPVDDEFRGMEVVYVRGTQGACMYLNACSIPFPLDHADPDQTDVVVQVAQNFYVVRADRLKGGQRLVLPCDAVQDMVEALLVGCPVCLSVGRYTAELVPDNFARVYEQLGCIAH